MIATIKQFVMRWWFEITLAGLVLGIVLYFYISSPLYFKFLYLLSYKLYLDYASKLQDFFTLSLSVLVEAIPFLILGVLISVIIQHFVPRSFFSKVLPSNRIARRLVMSFTGVLLPVCECGNVPIARSLMAKGVSTGDAITFLLAAPVLNPVVLITTWQAFRLDAWVFYGRFITAFIVANLVAILVTKLLKKDQILTKEFAHSCEVPHEHSRSISAAIKDFPSELWPLLKMLALGAVLAGLIQAFIPREVIVSIGSDAVWSVVAMIVLGFVISICSSVDAFFALAFARTFQSGSLTAFLVAGPMVDIKMVALLKTTFTTKAVALICALVFIFTMTAGITINYLAQNL